MFLEFSDSDGNLTVIKTYLSTKGQNIFTFVSIDRVEGTPMQKLNEAIGNELNKKQIEDICLEDELKCQLRSADDLETIVNESVAVVPTNVAISAITAESASATWDEGSDETAYEVAFGETGVDPDVEAQPVTEKSFDMEGLTTGTEYEFYVRSVKSESNKSAWVGPETFDTL